VTLNDVPSQDFFYNHNIKVRILSKIYYQGENMTLIDSVIYYQTVNDLINLTHCSEYYTPQLIKGSVLFRDVGIILFDVTSKTALERLSLIYNLFIFWRGICQDVKLTPHLRHLTRF
jgi:hypothetical protein